MASTKGSAEIEHSGTDALSSSKARCRSPLRSFFAPSTHVPRHLSLALTFFTREL